MLMPTVYRFMTTNPRTVTSSDPMTVAHQLMREHGIRHLPVVDAGKLVGIVSDRDLHLFESLKGVDPGNVRVEDAMTRDVLSVSVDTPLDDVLDRMSKARCGSVVVLGKHGVCGIFTASDALWALTDLLRREAA